MKIQLKHVVFCISLLVFNCKDQVAKDEVNTEVTERLSKAKKMKIVKYYLINDRKLTEDSMYEVAIKETPLGDSVKVILYEAEGPFFGFPFFEALEFYNANKK